MEDESGGVAQLLATLLTTALPPPAYFLPLGANEVQLVAVHVGAPPRDPMGMKEVKIPTY